MAKVCNFEGCNYPQFGGGYCRNHQWKRSDKKEKLKTYFHKPTGELAFFKEIWIKTEHKSYLSGKPLYKFSVSLFAHVLSKNKYPKWRLNPINIVLLTPEEHHMLDQGYKEQRERYAKENNCDWNKIYELQNDLKGIYEHKYSR